MSGVKRYERVHYLFGFWKKSRRNVWFHSQWNTQSCQCGLRRASSFTVPCPPPQKGNKTTLFTERMRPISSFMAPCPPPESRRIDLHCSLRKSAYAKGKDNIVHWENLQMVNVCLCWHSVIAQRSHPKQLSKRITLITQPKKLQKRDHVFVSTVY